MATHKFTTPEPEHEFSAATDVATVVAGGVVSGVIQAATAEVIDLVKTTRRPPGKHRAARGASK